MEFSDYDGMMPQMEEGTLIIDDLSHYEMEELIKKHKPDVFCAGIKEKYARTEDGRSPETAATATTTADPMPDLKVRSTSTRTSPRWYQAGSGIL